MIAYEILKAQFPNAQIYLGNPDYKRLPVEKIKELIQKFELWKYTYDLNEMNCGDYIAMFRGLAVRECYLTEPGGLSWMIGEVHGYFKQAGMKGHACGISITPDETIVLFEPAGRDLYVREFEPEETVDVIWA